MMKTQYILCITVLASCQFHPISYIARSMMGDDWLYTEATSKEATCFNSPTPGNASTGSLPRARSTS